MRHFFLLIMACLCFGCGTRYTAVPETASTLHNWGLAREYQAAHRFEMARQYYVLALADARTPNSQQALRQEIEAVERQIQAMR